MMTDPKLTEEELADMRCRRRPDSQLDRLLAEHREQRAEIATYEKLSDAECGRVNELTKRAESAEARVRELEAELEEVNGIGAQCAQELQVALGRVRELESEKATAVKAFENRQSDYLAERDRANAAEATLARVRKLLEHTACAMPAPWPLERETSLEIQAELAEIGSPLGVPRVPAQPTLPGGHGAVTELDRRVTELEQVVNNLTVLVHGGTVAP
jgi:chromosome segregation ATPase